MTARQVLLKIHLYLGLAAAAFLFVLGLTGSVMAFENDIPHWIHRTLFYVKTEPALLPEQELIRTVEQRFVPARVQSVQLFRERNLAQVMHLSGGLTVTVNPYNGALLGSWKGQTGVDRILGYIHQTHLRLAPDPRAAPVWSKVGKEVISWGGVFLSLLVPTGLVLFWRTRRATIKWSASWARIVFDAHHVVGIYSGLFLLIAGLTGIMIGFDWGEKAIYVATHSRPPSRQRPVESQRTAGAEPISADRAMGIARGAIANTTVAGVFLPTGPREVYTVLLRIPEDVSESVHSNVVVDQYTGRVLDVHNFLTDSPGFRLIRFNRAIHTGDILGTPTHILVSASSLLLVIMVVTGLLIWWHKLAV